MNLNSRQRQALLSNWGDAMFALQVYATARIYDPCSSWQCYLLGINPDYQDEIYCIISCGMNAEPIVTDWTFSDMSRLYNQQGEGVQIDQEFRPRMAYFIFNVLKGGYFGNARDEKS